MMRPYCFWIFCFLFCVASLGAQEAGLGLASLSPGESVDFGVYGSGFLRIGSGRLVYEGTTDCVPEGPGQGAALCQSVDFKIKSISVNDHEKITGTHDFSSPLKVLRDVQVFGRKENIEEIYAPDGRRVTIRKTVNKQKPQETVLTSRLPLGNVLLLIYRLRVDPSLTVGRVYDINLPTASFKLVVRGLRTLKVPLGRFRAYYIESEPKKYRIWLSADSRRLPLRIQGVAGGSAAFLAAVAVTPPVSE